MKKILCALALTVVAACGILGTSTGYDRENVQEAVELVCERHDSYVNADPTLNADQRIAYGHESFQAMACLGFDPIPTHLLQSALPPVLNRTEAYVTNDTSLTAPQQTRQLRTVSMLRTLIQPKN